MSKSSVLFYSMAEVTAAALGIASLCFEQISSVAKLVRKRLEMVKSNKTFCTSILEKIEDLKTFSVELKNLDKSDIFEDVRKKLAELYDALEIITEKCNSLQEKGQLKKNDVCFSCD